MIHPNGRGHVDDEAEARPAAFVDPDSKVTGRARAHSGRLISTELALEARFSNATAVRSIISCDEVTGGEIVECGLFDQVCVWDSPSLYRVKAEGGVRVMGQTVMRGPLDLYGRMRIAAGTWHRAPLFTDLGFCFLTEGPPGWAMVDCKFAPYARWFRMGERFARRHYDWSPEMLAQVRRVFTEWDTIEDLRGKHWGRCFPGCPR